MVAAIMTSDQKALLWVSPRIAEQIHFPFTGSEGDSDVKAPQKGETHNHNGGGRQWLTCLELVHQQQEFPLSLASQQAEGSSLWGQW